MDLLKEIIQTTSNILILIHSQNHLFMEDILYKWVIILSMVILMRESTRIKKESLTNRNIASYLCHKINNKKSARKFQNNIKEAAESISINQT
jgi:hypothetical protein